MLKFGVARPMALAPGLARARLLGYGGILGCPRISHHRVAVRGARSFSTRSFSTQQDYDHAMDDDEVAERSDSPEAPNSTPEATHAGGMLDYVRYDKMIDKLQLCSRLIMIDKWTADYVVEASGEMAKTFGEKAVERILPIFSEMSAVKELNAMYVERQHSLGSQKQSAEHAIEHLQDSIEALGKELEQNYWKLDSALNGYAHDRLKVRFESQIEALGEEAQTARTLMARMENTAGPRRAIEAVATLKVSELEAELASIFTRLRKDNLQMFYRNRDEADNLEALW